MAFYDKSWIKFERLLETYLAFAPAGLPSFLKAMPLWLKQKLWMGELIKKETGFTGEIVYPEHHQSHAASAFFPSPFERAAILTIDGVGEWATASWGVGHGNRVDLKYGFHFPHSLGLLYTAFTYYTGFKVNSGEYKVMGLAPYGEPRYVETILEELIDLKEDGSFRLNMNYFNYCQGLTMTSQAFDHLFGGPPRKPESPLTQREMDLARSIQDVTEEVMLRMARHVRAETGETHSVPGRRRGPQLRRQRKDPAREDLRPTSGSSRRPVTPVAPWAPRCSPGTRCSNKPRTADGRSRQPAAAPIWARVHDGRDRDVAVGARAIPITRYDDRARCAERGRRSDRRARRSSAGSPGPHGVRPAGAGRPQHPRRPALAEDAGGDEPEDQVPGVVPPVRAGVSARGRVRVLRARRRVALHAAGRPTSREHRRVRDDRRAAAVCAASRSSTCRASTSRRSPTSTTRRGSRPSTPATTRSYHRVLEAFKRRTGCGIVVNTSFNVRGEPIVCTPEDAYRCFMRTEMDVLVLEDCVLLKEEQPPLAGDTDWRSQYELD